MLPALAKGAVTTVVKAILGCHVDRVLSAWRLVPGDLCRQMLSGLGHAPHG